MLGSKKCLDADNQGSVSMQGGAIPDHSTRNTGETKKLPKKDWFPLLDCFEKKLEDWKGKYLFLGGKVVMLNALLSSKPLYFMSFFIMPEWVLEKIDRIKKRFL